MEIKTFSPRLPSVSFWIYFFFCAALAGLWIVFSDEKPAVPEKMPALAGTASRNTTTLPFLFLSITEGSADIDLGNPRLGGIFIRDIYGNGSVTRVYKDSLGMTITLKVSFNPAVVTCVSSAGLEGEAAGITTTYMSTVLATARKAVELRDESKPSEAPVRALLSLLDIPIAWESGQ